MNSPVPFLFRQHNSVAFFPPWRPGPPIMFKFQLPTVVTGSIIHFVWAASLPCLSSLLPPSAMNSCHSNPCLLFWETQTKTTSQPCLCCNQPMIKMMAGATSKCLSLGPGKALPSPHFWSGPNATGSITECWWDVSCHSGMAAKA